MSPTASQPPDLASVACGGAFLLESPGPSGVATPEDFTEEQLQVAATTDAFMSNEVVPLIGDLERQEPGLARKLLEKAGELGLLSVLVPEKYGGLELDMTTSAIVAERLGRYASFSTTYGAHADIGTRPLVFFGTEDQKRRYLPRLVTAEMMAAYCLSEPQAGSDALAARTRADLSPDGKHYILNGEKMWISNGGWADLYTVFAKVEGEKFTAFLVERTRPGVRPGSEEKKMGIKGSSTTPLVLENAAVPVENVLGEIGRGHVIALNILNSGRLGLGAACVGGGKDVLAESIRYAKQRKAFGRPIADFGLIQHKLAEMAIRLFATEAVVYRTSGLIDARFPDSWDDESGAKKALRALEEFAVECAIVKVYGSEALDYIVDEGVQIHGGYGFHQDYMVERAYRDSRINRIFEGTNEINRLLTPEMLLKRAAQGRLALMPAIEAAMKEFGGGVAGSDAEASGPLAAEKGILARAKKVALFGAGLSYQRYGKDLEKEQEILAALSDIVIAIYAMESAILRTEKLIAGGRGEAAYGMTQVLARDAMREIEKHAVGLLAACGEKTALENYVEILGKMTQVPLLDAIAARRKIAARLLEAEKLVV